MCYIIGQMKKVTELKVKGISLDRLANKPRLLLQDAEGDMTVALNINPYEANALIIEMENLSPSGPSTYDSIVNLFAAHGFTAISLVLHSFIQDSCLADLRYRKGLRKYSLKLRPSDGIALASRLRIPIFVPDGEKQVIKQSWAYPYDMGEKNREFLFLGQQRQQYPFL